MDHPLLYLRWARWKRGHRTVGKDTDIVIEGYPRSGTSFAVAAFTVAQPRPVKVAHHHHAPAQIIVAARWSIPALVVMRDPDDAVLSRLIRAPHIRAAQSFADYCRFHNRLRPYRDHFVLATFPSVTTDFGSVVRKINQRFGTAFAEFEHTDQNVERCFRIIEARNRASNQGALGERGIARPSASRDRWKAEALTMLDHPDLAELRRAARAIFDELSAATDL